MTIVELTHVPFFWDTCTKSKSILVHVVRVVLQTVCVTMYQMYHYIYYIIYKIYSIYVGVQSCQLFFTFQSSVGQFWYIVVQRLHKLLVKLHENNGPFLDTYDYFGTWGKFNYCQVKIAATPFAYLYDQKYPLYAYRLILLFSISQIESDQRR